MKKISVLTIVFVFVIGVISFNVFMPYTPTFENMPVSFKNSWHIERDNNRRYDQILVNLDITNNSKKTIKNLKISYYCYIHNDLPYVNYRDNINLLKLNRDVDIIRSGQTVSISLQLFSIGSVGNITDSDVEFLFDRVDKLELEIYVHWAQYTWFGGQWGDVFGSLRHVDGELDNLSSSGIKIDMEPYIKT
ncbi:MAG: arrestin family protein [Chloroflexi bacterium]|nr:arrestin family protein [Chloroflexota bacterium]